MISDISSAQCNVTDSDSLYYNRDDDDDHHHRDHIAVIFSQSARISKAESEMMTWIGHSNSKTHRYILCVVFVLSHTIFDKSVDRDI